MAQGPPALLAALILALSGCGGKAEPTVPEPARPGETVIVAVGDISCPAAGAEVYDEDADEACRQQDTYKLARAIEPDAVLALGDLQYETGSLEEFRSSYARTWGKLKSITRPVAGNHEYEEDERASGFHRYFDVARSGWYSFDIGSWHVIALNSNCDYVGCGEGSRQERWLRRDLAANRARCTLAFWHHARYSSGDHGPDERTAAFWQALHEADADLVLAGHEHSYERFARMDAAGDPDPTGIPSIVVGTGGRDLTPQEEEFPGSEVFSSESFGVLRLVLRRDGYAWRFVATEKDGFADSGEGRCR